MVKYSPKKSWQTKGEFKNETGVDINTKKSIQNIFILHFKIIFLSIKFIKCWIYNLKKYNNEHLKILKFEMN
jgi:hypothetical protein